ncbi:MAG: GNAT family N-acetyltransferase [Thermoleophilia bacterium]
MPIEVVDAPQRTRYEISVDGEVVGFADYRDRDGTRAITHTEIDPRRRGGALGRALVAGALRDIRARGLSVLPLCSFVGAYLARHPEERDLLPGARRTTGDP